MARESDNRLVVICSELAVLAAALILLTARLPQPESTIGSLLGGARFVAAVAATIFGFIVWFERRYPLEGAAVGSRARRG
jgi:hypothetical protein